MPEVRAALKARKKLRMLLAGLYPRDADQRRVARDAGLSEGDIAFDAKAVNSWDAILREAKRCSRLTELADVALADHPEKDQVRALSNIYAEGTDLPSARRVLGGVLVVAIGGATTAVIYMLGGINNGLPPRPGSSSSPVESQVSYDIACDGSTIQVVVKNEAPRALSIFGFTLSPVYNAIYPRVAAHVGQVPKYDPLEVALDKPQIKSTSGPKLIEVPKHDSGLIEIPLILTAPDTQTLYVQATRLCVRLSVSADATCLPKWLVVLDSSDRGSHCKVTTDDALAKSTEERLARFEAPDDADALKMLAAIRPTDAEELILKTFAASRPEHVAVRLDLLDAMSKLAGAVSLERLKQVEHDVHRSTSERIRALLSHALRDPLVDKKQMLLSWVQDADPDLAVRSLELLPYEGRGLPCVNRIAKLRCDDGFLVMQCGATGDEALAQSIASWREHCKTP